MRRTPKKQRLIIVSTAVLAVAGAILLILFAMGGESLSLFRQPSEIKANPVPVGQRIKLGGLVADGSYVRLDDGVTDRRKLSVQRARMQQAQG